MASEYLVTDRKEEKPRSRLKGAEEAEEVPAHSSSSWASREENLPCTPAHGTGTAAKSSHTGSVPATCSSCGRCLQGQNKKWVR